VKNVAECKDICKRFRGLKPNGELVDMRLDKNAAETVEFSLFLMVLSVPAVEVNCEVHLNQQSIENS